MKTETRKHDGLSRLTDRALVTLAAICVCWHPVTIADTSQSGDDGMTGSTGSPVVSSWLTGPTLTGDWGGLRSLLAGKGVDFDFRYTTSYQGMFAGSGNDDFRFGGKVDAFIDLDGSQMGLWNGSGFHTHVEYSHGEAPANLGGALFASNTAQYWPVDTPEKWVATSLYFTQVIGDKGSISLGKFNPVDVYAEHFFNGGWGIDRFMNVVFAAPPSGIIPVVFMGAVASFKVKTLTWTVIACDPNDRTNDYFPGDLFEDGINIGVNATRAITLAGRETSFGVTTLYSTAEGVDYSSIGGGLVYTSNKSGAYNINFQLKHNLQESGSKSNEAWGLYIKAALADGNPNYVQSSIIVGVAGRALFLDRPQDSFGLGAFYYNLSDELKDALEPGTRFGNEAGIEAFYNYSVTPWLYITPDIQYIRPARGGFKNALVAALRLQIRF